MSDISPRAPNIKVQNIVFALILVLLFIMVCRLFAPFFTVLLWSTLLYVILSPLHRRVIRKIDFSTPKGMILKNIWAAVFALGAMIIILIPLGFIISLFSRQIADLMRHSHEIFNRESGMLADFLNRVSVFIRDLTSGEINISGEKIRERIVETAAAGLQNMVSASSAFARNVGKFIMGLVLMLFCLFFFFADGPYLARLVFHAVPIRKEYIRALSGKFMEITRNLFFGYIMVALVQAVMAYIIFAVFHVAGALVFAVLTFICVFIPMIGGGIVWLPLGIFRIFSGDVTGGIIFLVVSGTFISLLDNVLRPFFLKDRIQLHPLVIFFAILGGVSVFGFNGLILGPMAVIFFLTVLDMFLREHEISAE
ncbi:MAG: AI-2E family transporter [Treponema sp.]|jgi:predicted PurR-regulated permease PerM|nr:AI-2E family transporter [Treponema sp.]